jgi:hypothetical protein
MISKSKGAHLIRSYQEYEETNASKIPKFPIIMFPNVTLRSLNVESMQIVSLSISRILRDSI